MSVTRAQVEAELISRRQAMLKAAEMDVTFQGANPDLNGPIGYAVRQCGGTVASLSAVVSSDIQTVDEADIDKLLDLAEYRLLMNIKGRWAKVDLSSGPFSQSLNQFADQLDTDLAAMKENLEYVHGFGSGSLQVGVIDLSFMETDPDA
jgi:hypothetical protein